MKTSSIKTESEKTVTDKKFDRFLESIGKSFNRNHEQYVHHEKWLDRHEKILDRHEKMFQIFLKETAISRKEHKEYRREMNALYGSLFRNEQDVKKLDTRVLRLEIAGARG